MDIINTLTTFSLLVGVFGYDPNYRNIFYQTTKEVQNQPLSDITGEIPSWIEGDFVRQSCASYGDIDGNICVSYALCLTYCVVFNFMLKETSN